MEKKKNWKFLVLEIWQRNLEKWGNVVGASGEARFIGVWGARWDVSSSHIDLLSGIDRPGKIDFENFLWDFLSQKWRFFSIFQKYVLNTILRAFIVSGHFPEPKRPNSGHIWHFRPHPDNIGRIEKIDFFDNFAKLTYIMLYIWWPGPAGNGRRH